MVVTTIIDKRMVDTGGGEGPSGFHLVVLARDGAWPRPLPAEGTILIGRDESADLRIADARASRHHARLTITASSITLEDLGSANGTRLRDKPLPARTPASVERGDVIAIGSTMLVLQAGTPEQGVLRVWAHGYLETRLIEACARAQSLGTRLALARVHVPDHALPFLVEDVIGSHLRAGDLLAAYAPRKYELLLADSDATDARARTEEMLAALAGNHIPATLGLAFFPTDGASPQALVGCAAERVRAAAAPERDAAAPIVAGGPAIVLESPAMRELHAIARRAAAGNSTVLIIGETGSGKEVLAETVHQTSPRAKKPFVAFNCAALNETLLESELFGHERGAFTGANQIKLGLLETAAGGTVFLDEVGEMPLGMQAALLRVIETRQVLRVGATQPRAIDVRFVAATNRDLEEEVAEKRFRQDLYFRLNVITLELPPLRERVEEIEPLARLFLARLAEPLGRPAPALSGEAIELLRAATWPGNIRELRNVIERAFVLCSGPAITAEHLPVEKLRRPPVIADRSTAPASITGPNPVISVAPAAEAAPPAAASPAPAPSSGAGPPPVLRDLERQAMIDALQRCLYNQTRAAELLGMPRRTFCKRLKEYGIPRPRV